MSQIQPSVWKCLASICLLPRDTAGQLVLQYRQITPPPPPSTLCNPFSQASSRVLATYIWPPRISKITKPSFYDVYFTVTANGLISEPGVSWTCDTLGHVWFYSRHNTEHTGGPGTGNVWLQNVAWLQYRRARSYNRPNTGPSREPTSVTLSQTLHPMNRLEDRPFLEIEMVFIVFFVDGKYCCDR